MCSFNYELRIMKDSRAFTINTDTNQSTNLYWCKPAIELCSTEDKLVKMLQTDQRIKEKLNIKMYLTML